MRHILALLFTATLFVALTGCESLFFYPDKTLYYYPALIMSAPVDTAFISKDNSTTLHGWFFSPKEKPKGYILYLHGNGGNVSSQTPAMLWLVKAGYRLFTFDYRGYGISQGAPDIKGVVDDSLAAFDFMLRAVPADEKVYILGQSMGGALAIDLAALTTQQARIKAVITDSAFSSWRVVARETADKYLFSWAFQYPISWFFDDKYSPITLYGRIPENIPLIHIHNIGDRVVRSNHSEKLAKAGGKRAKLWMLNYSGHITSLVHSDFQQQFLECLVSMPDRCGQ
ncbi:alpha/beta hydrolase [Deferribacterales bacterium RsTz2092]